MEPTFGNEAATSFFSEVYHSDPRNFVQPDWMLTPCPPEVELDCSQFSVSELARDIKKMRAQSAPSPFDRVGYTSFKKLPSSPWPSQALQHLLGSVIHPWGVEVCCHHQELIFRGYHQPGQLPTDCPNTLCWQALFHSAPESLAEVHGHQQVSRQFTSEGFHTNSA